MRTLSLLSLALLLAVPVAAQDTDWQRYYPLEAGDTWEYRYYRTWCFVDECVSSERFEQRTVLGEIELDGVPYVEMEISEIDRSTGEAECTVTFAVRVNEETEMVEAEHLAGSCGFYAPELEVPLTIGIPSEDVVSIGGISYSLMVRSEYVYLENNALEEGWMTFAQDVGLLASDLYSGIGPGGDTVTTYALVYAEVGGVVYGTPSVASEEEAAPTEFALGAAYPNPFRASVTFPLSLPAPEPVALSVHDVLGRRVLERDLGVQPAGETRYTLDGRVLTPGIYFVRVTTDSGQQATRRIVRVE